MAVFPLPIIPQADYHYSGIAFGAETKNRGTRRHAACDLIAPPGTPVYAVERGVVLEVPKKPFYQSVYTVVVRHNNFIIRYTELDQHRPVAVGEEVYEGQQIGTVGRNNKDRGMLHIEMYRGTASGPLSQEHNMNYLYVEPLNYQRRKDLIDPTPYLDEWRLWTDFSVYQSQEPANWSE